jgi:tRNA A-37 threonylcarbamoyl transferase component Bud32
METKEHENKYKQDVYSKLNVEFHEYNMHNYIYHLGIINVPMIVSYNKKTKLMEMEKIPAMCIADMYGENFSDLPDWIKKQIIHIIQTLKSNNIIYPDITGYNFIEHKEKIYIIDFEHAYFGYEPTQSNWFVDEFVKGLESWNPDFA